MPGLNAAYIKTPYTTTHSLTAATFYISQLHFLAEKTVYIFNHTDKLDVYHILNLCRERITTTLHYSTPNPCHDSPYQAHSTWHHYGHCTMVAAEGVPCDL